MHNQHQQQGAQSKSGFVPKKAKKKREKLGVIWGRLGFGFLWGKMGKWGYLVVGGGWEWRREAGGGTGVVGL
jgi:hypothetical protein